MHIDLVRDESALAALQSEWNSLLAGSATRAPFLRAEYMQAWWRHRGGGEWPQAELLLAAARSPAGELLALAPLFRTPRNRDGRAALMLLGSVEISDYLDFIAPRAQAGAFAAALLERLSAADAPAWEVLDLYNLPAASPTRAALARAARGRGWVARQQELEPVPVIPLPGDFEVYLATMVDKKERQEIRRKLRRAEGGDDRITWHIVGPEHDLAAETEAFLQLMALNPDKARFLTSEMRAQFVDTLRAAAAHGWLHLAFLEINGEKAAAYLSFDFGNRLWVYNSAIDPRFNALSPGWVLLAHLLRWCIENGRREFDFLRGGEDYKFRFGAVAGQIFRLQVSPGLEAAALGGDPAAEDNPLEAEVFPGG